MKETKITRVIGRNGEVLRIKKSEACDDCAALREQLRASDEALRAAEEALELLLPLVRPVDLAMMEDSVWGRATRTGDAALARLRAGRGE